MKNDMARTIAAAMALFAFMPLAAAVSVNEGRPAGIVPPKDRPLFRGRIPCGSTT